jgi:peptidoglycan/xylan/chitin deacetylase (PgdA/CDA1 family)
MPLQRQRPARLAAAALCLSGVALVSGCGALGSVFTTASPATTPVAASATPTAVHAPGSIDGEGFSRPATPPPMFTVGAPPTTSSSTPTVTISAIPAPTTATTTAPAPVKTTAAKPAPAPAPAKTTSAKPAPAPAPVPVPASGPAVTGCGNPNPGKVLLTFDDGGPTAPALLSILDRYGIKARWFPTGVWAGANAAFIARLKADGQMLGNHTYSHPQMYAALGTAELRRQIDLGYHPTTVFRFPYGASDEVSRAMVRSAGYSICGWNIDTNDWRGSSAATITSTVTGQARPGSVVLMHMKFQADVDALPGIIETLRSRGLV